MPDNSNIQNIVNQAANVMVQNDVLPVKLVDDDPALDKIDQIIAIAQNIDKNLDKIAKGTNMPSQTAAAIHATNAQQANAGYNAYGHNYGNPFGGLGGGHWGSGGKNQWGNFGRHIKNQGNSFIDGFEDALLDGLIDSGFRDDVRDIFEKFANDLGVQIKDLPHEIGKRLGQNALKAFKDTDAGGRFFDGLDAIKDMFKDQLRDKGQDFIDALIDGDLGSGIGEGAGHILEMLENSGEGLVNGLKTVGQNVFKFGSNFASQLSAMPGVLGSAGTALSGALGAASTSLSSFTASMGAGAAGAGAAGAGLAALSAAVPPLLVAVGLVAGAMIALEIITNNLALGFDGLKTIVNGLKKTTTRDFKSREASIKAATTRLSADIETLVKRPFEILEEAAQSWYNTWDNNLKVINATQGYTKSDLQDLMSAYSSRLQSEGLTAYVSGADVSDNLAKVLMAGLSGAAAEEFAYQATKLNAAVPTQDFFSYASTYASVAANAVKAGKSQTEALEEANASLSSFTSGLLYASRQLSGGFTTGLQDASNVYEQAVKISQASKTGSITDIASVLLAVRGEVGAVAPDLASSITDAIYKTLMGGNSADIVALRSLAGVNASNTEFLRAVANDPQKIFSTMFENLGNMYSQSSDAYMEKAEGYAQLFGLSSEAFARIDFNELSSAISKMNMSDASLNENMKLLVEGQTTTSAEQLKNQQINQVMIEEGLSLVLDNAAARAIQQHMWDEQIARELQESTYAVDLQGEAAEGINKIVTAVQNLLGFANPLAWTKKVGNLVATVVETKQQKADIEKVLELGKVGSGNAKSQYQLTTRNQDLGVTEDLVTLMGGKSSYKSGLGAWGDMTNPYFTAMNLTSKITKVVTDAQSKTSANKSSTPASQYKWGSVGKSAATAAASLLKSGSTKEYSKINTSGGTEAASSSASAVKSKIDKMLSDEYLVDKYIRQGKTYEDWASSASSFGISNLSQALSDAGYKESDVEAYFQNKETERGLLEQAEIRQHEREFREKGIAFWTETFWVDYKDPEFEKLDIINTSIETLTTELKTFRDDTFTKYATWWQGDTGWGWWTGTETGWSQWITNKEGWDWWKSNKDGWTWWKDNKDGWGWFVSEFTKYFIKHTYYSSGGGYSYSQVKAVQKSEDAHERGATVKALAEMLTTNALDLQDPQRQTNALLAQILIYVSSIEAKLNDPGMSTSSIASTLSAMALNLTGSSNTNGTGSSTGNDSDVGNSGATSGKGKKTVATKI